MGLYIGNEKIGGGLITSVNALPEANATNYAKNQLYLYENKLYFIVLDSGTYKYKRLGADTPSGFNLTLKYSVMQFFGEIELADGTIVDVDADGYMVSNDVTIQNVVKIKSGFEFSTCGHGLNNVTLTPSDMSSYITAPYGSEMFTSDYELTQDTTINNDDGTCLDGDTLILTKNGYAKIKDINVDTELLTFNHQTGENEYKKVSRWWHHPSSDIVIVNDTIKMTGDHPIYRNDYEVVKARELKKGQYLIDKDGNKITINSVEYSTDTIEVYMIEVEDNHNFYITENNILSHNY